MTSPVDIDITNRPRQTRPQTFALIRPKVQVNHGPDALVLLGAALFPKEAKVGNVPVSDGEGVGGAGEGHHAGEHVAGEHGVGLGQRRDDCGGGRLGVRKWIFFFFCFGRFAWTGCAGLALDDAGGSRDGFWRRVSWGCVLLS